MFIPIELENALFCWDGTGGLDVSRTKLLCGEPTSKTEWNRAGTRSCILCEENWLVGQNPPSQESCNGGQALVLVHGSC